MVILMYSSLYFSICLTYGSNNQSFWTKAIFQDFPDGLVVNTIFQCSGAGLIPSGGTRIPHASGLGQKKIIFQTLCGLFMALLNRLELLLASICLNNSETFRYFTQQEVWICCRQFNSKGRVSIISQTAWVLPIFTLCQFCDCKMINRLSLALCAQTKTLKVERKAVFSLSASVIGKEMSSKCSRITFPMSSWPDLAHIPSPRATDDEEEQHCHDIVTTTCTAFSPSLKTSI